VIEPTCSQRDAASVLFNLSGYRVVQAVDSPLGIRKVVVESLDREGGCPSCGVNAHASHGFCRVVRGASCGGSLRDWGPLATGGQHPVTLLTREVGLAADCAPAGREGR
jgi:hypothetical protein